jgi:hypothetical protein
MPGTATTVFEEGLAIPPIKLYDAGVRNEAVFTIVKRNTRVPEMLAADLDSEVKACVMAARRMEGLFARFGRDTVEACFQAILDKCRDIYRRELLPKIADGEYSWTDYVEHDGVTDPKLHKLALRMIAGRAHHARLHRHRSAVDRSDQLAGRLCRRRVSHQMDRADPAQSRRHARTRGRDPCQRGRLRGLRHRVPAEGYADHAGMAGRDQCALVRAAALPRAARGGRRAGGRRPHAGRPGDHPLYRGSATTSTASRFVA